MNNRFFRALWSILLAILIITGIVLCCRFDYYVWRLQHPTAPTWTYFFK